MKEKCSHSFFEDKEITEKYFNHKTGGVSKRTYIEKVEVSSFEDIDIDSYKCTKCNEVFFYNSNHLNKTTILVSDLKKETKINFVF